MNMINNKQEKSSNRRRQIKHNINYMHSGESCITITETFFNPFEEISVDRQPP